MKTALNTSRTRSAKKKAQKEYTTTEEEHQKGQEGLHRQPSQSGGGSSRAGEPQRPVPGDQEAGRQVPADRQASEGQGREPTDDN